MPGARSSTPTPQRSVFVGDAVWEVQAARRLGMPCIGLEGGGTSAAELREAGADEAWSTPADLIAHWSDSVLTQGKGQARGATG